MIRDIDRVFARLMNQLQDAYDDQVRLALRSPNTTVRRQLEVANARVRGLIAEVRTILDERPVR